MLNTQVRLSWARELHWRRPDAVPRPGECRPTISRPFLSEVQILLDNSNGALEGCHRCAAGRPADQSGDKRFGPFEALVLTSKPLLRGRALPDNAGEIRFEGLRRRSVRSHPAELRGEGEAGGADSGNSKKRLEPRSHARRPGRSNPTTGLARPRIGMWCLSTRNTGQEALRHPNCRYPTNP